MRGLRRLVCFFELPSTQGSAVRRGTGWAAKRGSAGGFLCQKNGSHRTRSVAEGWIALKEVRVCDRSRACWDRADEGRFWVSHGQVRTRRPSEPLETVGKLRQPVGTVPPAVLGTVVQREKVQSWGEQAVLPNEGEAQLCAPTPTLHAEAAGSPASADPLVLAHTPGSRCPRLLPAPTGTRSAVGPPFPATSPAGGRSLCPSGQAGGDSGRSLLQRCGSPPPTRLSQRGAPSASPAPHVSLSMAST